MQQHEVRVQQPGERLGREQQLAWKIAELAADPVDVTPAVMRAIAARLIDNAAVAMAAFSRQAVVTARAMALAHPRRAGATLWGLPLDTTVCCEWAAWANGTAVRELDFHDTFLGVEYAHPADCLPPLIATAQQVGSSGAALARAVATSYEVHVGLARGICLHEHGIDHVAHLGPAIAAGLGTLLGLAPPVIHQAVGQALHVTCATRQSRKGEISSWKAFAPAFAGKVAIEAIDRCMRGERAPCPIYEGADGVIARMLAGPEATYVVPLPGPGEPRRAILDTFTKEHSAEYQAQAVIDLAFRVSERLASRIGSDWDAVRSVVLHTSHHTHHVIGSGARDPEKMDPAATRETLDHSVMYILAVALQDRAWHHERSYATARANRPDTVALWQRISTVEDPAWTQRYHSADLGERAYGGRLVVTLRDGSQIQDELAVAHAHPLGERPSGSEAAAHKLCSLTEGLVAPDERARYLERVAGLAELDPRGVAELTIACPPEATLPPPKRGGIF